MKAVILCAGKGKRLRPFSYSIPKHLLPVCNQPVLGYLLDELHQSGMIKEVAIIVSRETYEPIQEYLNQCSTLYPFHFTYLLQEKPLGLAHACGMAESFIGKDEFMMLLGDNIIPGGVNSAILKNPGEITADATVLVRKVEDPRPYGVVEFDQEGNIISMEEKPVHPKSNFVIVGIYRFTPNIFSSIHQIKPSSRGELEITDAIFHLAKNGNRVKAQIFDGVFLDIGSPETYLAANQYMIEHFHKTPIHNTSVALESRINWDVSLGEGTKVIHSSLTNCIVLSGSCIQKTNLQNSIIGRNCCITLNHSDKKAVQLILGDDSLINKEE